MCGNFGLIAIKSGMQGVTSSSTVSNPIQAYKSTSRTITSPLKDPIDILEAQTAATEIRGGQAGGYSSIEWPPVLGDNVPVCKPISCRVRCVARKRYPLAADLSKLYKSKAIKPTPGLGATVNVIGHTRFATSSKNIVSELHPHEFDTWKIENVWAFQPSTRRFEKTASQVGEFIQFRNKKKNIST
jgi:hypothetical protein